MKQAVRNLAAVGGEGVALSRDIGGKYVMSNSQSKNISNSRFRTSKPSSREEDRGSAKGWWSRYV